MIRANAWTLGLIACATLAACGGGGSDSPATPSSVTIAGTAAKGAALAGAAVSIKCAAGTGTATTGSDGKYSVAITGANLPCALKVVGTEGSVFHSVVAGTGSTGTFAANLTPLTEMLVAKLAGTSPGAFFNGFASGTAVTSASLADAIAYVKSALAGATDLTGVNPATDALTVGDAHDQKIDAAMARLASIGVTLEQAIAAILANPSAPDVVAAPLRLAASDCAWLKSGKYRMINPYETDPKWQAHVLNVNAGTKTFTDQDGIPGSLTPNGACQYTIADSDATHRVMVSSGGVLVVHTQSTAVPPVPLSVTVGLPEQTLPVSTFAGTWNFADWIDSDSATGKIAAALEIAVDNTGQITAVSACMGLAACTSEGGPFPKLTVNATSGGFDMVANGASVGRAFVYKTLGGKMVAVVVLADGEFLVGTLKEALGTLPAVGTVSDFRQFSLNGNGTLSALSEDFTTVTANDTTARTVTRQLNSNGRIDTLGYDKPRNGLRHRSPNSCSIGGVASNCAEFVQLPLQGMGITLTLSVGTNPATTFYQVSVGKPAN